MSVPNYVEILFRPLFFLINLCDYVFCIFNCLFLEILMRPDVCKIRWNSGFILCYLVINMCLADYVNPETLKYAGREIGCNNGFHYAALDRDLNEKKWHWFYDS